MSPTRLLQLKQRGSTIQKIARPSLRTLTRTDFTLGVLAAWVISFSNTCRRCLKSCARNTSTRCYLMWLSVDLLLCWMERQSMRCPSAPSTLPFVSQLGGNSFFQVGSQLLVCLHSCHEFTSRQRLELHALLVDLLFVSVLCDTHVLACM
jgi:hypothetical protein